MSTRILVYGDLHANIEPMYRHALQLQEETGEKIDAILQVGDFSAARAETARRKSAKGARVLRS